MFFAEFDKASPNLNQNFRLEFGISENVILTGSKLV
jgi:hypothetical protein